MPTVATRTPPPKARQGVVIYRGPSALDGSPIVAMVPGRKSQNSKTGDMLQVFILRGDMDPVAAVNTGADAGICGTCPHRGPIGDRSCYVQVARAPLSMYRAMVRGSYRDETTAEGLAALGRGKRIRLGAYGDPAAVPVAIWRALLREADGWTGYTHAWRAAPHLRSLCMASVDSEAEAIEATARGGRYFRVSLAGADPMPFEARCPAAAESGKATTCRECLLCDGSSVGDMRRSIAIDVHGDAVTARVARSRLAILQ